MPNLPWSDYPHDLCIPKGGLANPSQRHPDSARFHQLLQEIGELHDQKQKDYGRPDAPFANLESANEFNHSPFVGTLVRMNDKMSRLKTYVRTGKLANEGVIDSLKDLAVYALANIVLFEKQLAQDKATADKAAELGLRW